MALSDYLKSQMTPTNYQQPIDFVPFPGFKKRPAQTEYIDSWRNSNNTPLAQVTNKQTAPEYIDSWRKGQMPKELVTPKVNSRPLNQLNQQRPVRQITPPKLANINQPITPENIQGSQRTLLEQQQDLANYYQRYPKTISQINPKTGERVIVEDPTALNQALRNVATLGGADIGAQASMYGADTGLERQRLANIGAETTARIGAERGRYDTKIDPLSGATTTIDTMTGRSYQNGIETPRITFDEAAQTAANAPADRQADALRNMLNQFPTPEAKQTAYQRYLKLRGLTE